MAVFIRVAPLRSLPVTHAEFDYVWKSESPPQIGDLIIVPFRQRTLPAVITMVLSKSTFARRVVDSTTTQPLLSTYDIAFLQEAAAALVAPLGKLIQFMLPRINRKKQTLLRRQNQRSLLKGQQIRYLWFNSPNDRMNNLAKIVRDMDRASGLLIVAAHTARAQEIFTTLPGDKINKFIISGEKSLLRRQAWETWINPNTRRCVIVGTHLPVWLPYRPQTTVLLDDPTDPWHEQWDGIKYNNYLIARWRAKIFGDSVVLLAHSPVTADLDRIQHLPALAHWPRIIDITQKDPTSKQILPESCCPLILSARRTLIILPQLTDSRYQVCVDCQTLFTTAAKILVCANCQGVNLLTLGLSVAKIEKELRELGIKTDNLIRFTPQKKSFKKGFVLPSVPTIILSTSAASWLLPLAQFDLIIDLSLDFSLMHPDYASAETLWKKLRQTASALLPEWTGTWIVLTRHPHLSAFAVRDQIGFVHWWKSEEPLRRRFQQPPFNYLTT